jgi:PAS domain S-box-containing protein
METSQGHASTRAPSRALGGLLLLGAALSFSTLVLPSDPGLDHAAVALLDTIAAVVGFALLVMGARMPRLAIPVFLVGAIAVVTLGAHYSGEPGGGYVLVFYLWGGLYAGLYLSRRLVVTTIAAVAIAYGLVLILDPIDTAVAHWIVVVATTGVAAAVVHVLVTQARARADELSRSEREARAVLESSQDAFVIVTDDGTIRDWNSAAEYTLGWSKREALDANIEIVLTASSRRFRREAVRRYQEDGDDSLLRRRTELTFLHRDGREVPVELSLSPIEFGGKQFFVCALHDISERKAADRILDAQYQVRSVLAESRRFEDALLELLRAQGESMGWDLGAYWTVDEASGRLRRLEMWREEDVAESFSQVAELELGGAVGNVWTTGRARWLDLEGDGHSGDGHVTRLTEAKGAGFRSGLILPVRTAQGPVAVAEFYSRQLRPLDREVIVVMTALNAQIAAFVERRRAEERDRAEAETIAAVAEATRSLSATTDPGDARTAIVRAARSIGGADGAALYEPDFERDALVSTAGSDDSRPPVPEVPLSGSETSATARVFQTGEPLFIGELRGASGTAPSLVRRSGLRAAFIQPVRQGDRVVGVLTTGWRRPLPAAPERVPEMLALLADEAAVAIQRTELLTRLREVARSDELTGLENRRGWEELLDRELARCKRDGQPLTIAMLSVGGRNGVGERALKETAAAWRDQLRATDVLARLDAGLFATLHPACDGDAAMELVMRLTASGPGDQCTAGIAERRQGDTVAELAERAVQALTLAQQRGGVVLAG